MSDHQIEVTLKQICGELAISNYLRVLEIAKSGTLFKEEYNAVTQTINKIREDVIQQCEEAKR
jgi:uncharacterized spore protein YtfJ